MGRCGRFAADAPKVRQAPMDDLIAAPGIAAALRKPGADLATARKRHTLPVAGLLGLPAG